MFQYSFGCVFFHGLGQKIKGTDYVKECVKNVLKQSANIQGVEFACKSYLKLNMPKTALFIATRRIRIQRVTK